MTIHSSCDVIGDDLSFSVLAACVTPALASILYILPCRPSEAALTQHLIRVCPGASDELDLEVLGSNHEREGGQADECENPAPHKGNDQGDGHEGKILPAGLASRLRTEPCSEST
jgi:hypothetical protein